MTKSWLNEELAEEMSTIFRSVRENVLDSRQRTVASLPHYLRPGRWQTRLGGQVWLAAYFCKECFSGAQPTRWFMGTFVLQW